MILREGVVLLEYPELVNDACISKPAYDKAAREGRVTVVQRGGDGHPALIEWHTLPAKYKELVQHHLKGDPEVLARAQAVEQHLVSDAKDSDYLDQFKADNGYGLTADNRQRLGLAARILGLLAQADAVMREGGTANLLATYGLSAMALKDAVCNYVKANRARLPKSFPASFARLEARKRDYIAAVREGMPGASTLIHGNAGNSAASKLPKQLQRDVLLRVVSRPQNYSLRRNAMDYNTIAATKGWPQISAGTVRHFLANGQNGRTATIYAKGGAAYHNKYNIVVRRSAPTQPTYMWVHDATDYERLFQQEVNGKRTYHHRKKVCVVVDPNLGYPVGYAIGETDTVELTQEAFRNAVRHMRELTGSYALPYQVQSDRMGWKTLGDWYKAMDIKYTPARRKNARSKIIEPWFAQHNDHFANSGNNWSGHNVTAKLTNQPNPDALDAHKKDFPNEATVIEQIHADMARHRATKVEAFRAALAAMPQGELRTLGRTAFLEQLGTRHEWTNELTNMGLCPTLLGEERTYQMLERNFQDCIGASFQVVYDPADLSDVLAIDQTNEKRRFLVPAFQRVPMALKDHSAESRRQLAEIEAFKSNLSQEAIDKVLNDQDQIRLLAESLMADAMLKLNKHGHLDRDDGPAPTATSPEEEVVRKNYLIQGGSHKAALSAAAAEAQRRANIERWAEDNF
jgi:hypothetical protein